jgi:chemotaxis protein methyltransferase CheR
MKLTDLELISSIVYKRTGIVLGPQKDYLIDTRLAPIARQFGHLSVEQLVQSIRGGCKTAEDAAVESMTTNETLFFRDKLPFDNMANVVIPELLKKRSPNAPLRIWCVACSSGQEPYSLSMMLNEMGLSAKQVTIMATDVSHLMVERAKKGIYSQFEIQRGLPEKLLREHFQQEGLTWLINPKLAERIEFRQLNILDDFNHLGVFDIIFCRNLLIYFDETRKRDVLSRLRRSMSNDGYLFLGAAETVLGLTQDIVPHHTAKTIYVHAGTSEAQQSYRPSTAHLNSNLVSSNLMAFGR